jgi:WD40 repeat protein
MMRDYQIPITLSALQVYHSGVITMPERALRRHAIASHRTAHLILERDRDWQTETVILEGHSGCVHSVACSSDGSRIVSGSRDGTIRIWDAISCGVQLILKGHTGSVRSVAFSSDGLRIASGSADHTVRIWDAVSGVVQHNLRGHGNCVHSVAFSSDGLRIVSGSDGRTVRIWDAVSGVVQYTWRDYSHLVRSVALSSDGSRIFLGPGDRTGLILDVHGGAAPQVLRRVPLASSPLRNGLCSHLICSLHRLPVPVISQQRFKSTSSLHRWSIPVIP